MQSQFPLRESQQYCPLLTAIRRNSVSVQPEKLYSLQLANLSLEIQVHAPLLSSL